MDEPSEDIDEVALNVLLAEGLDVPTAGEASRRDSGEERGGWGCLGSGILLTATIIAATVLLR
jgi:hypothetical protein